MKVTLLKISRKKEVINRLDLREVADLIRQYPLRCWMRELQGDSERTEIQRISGSRGEWAEDLWGRSDH